MARARYLADTSVWARLSQRVIAEAFAPLASGGQVGVCGPVAFELLYSARSIEDYRQVADRLRAFPHVDVVEADHRRALEIQELLVERGQHRAPSLVDCLLAASAERVSLIVLHYDHDFELIAAVTNQPVDWIVPRGSAD